MTCEGSSARLGSGGTEGVSGLSTETEDIVLRGRSVSVLVDVSADDSAERERFARRFMSDDSPMLSAMPTDSPMRTFRTTASHVSLTAQVATRLRLSGLLPSIAPSGSLLAASSAGDMRSMSAEEPPLPAPPWSATFRRLNHLERQI